MKEKVAYNKAIEILNSPVPSSSLEKQLAMLFLSNPSYYMKETSLMNDISLVYNRVLNSQAC